MLKEAFGNLNNIYIIIPFKVLGVRFGVEQTDIAKVLRAQTENIRIITRTSFKCTKFNSRISKVVRGVLAKDVFSDIASNTELFANFAKRRRSKHW